MFSTKPIKPLFLFFTYFSFLFGLFAFDCPAQGTLDPDFGSGGRVTTDFNSTEDFGIAIAIQPDGKFLVAGYTSTESGFYDFALARYNPNGSLDTGFGAGGRVTTDFGSIFDFGDAISLQPDGKIVVVGNAGTGSSYGFAVARYNSDGTLDNTFDNDGKVVTSFSNGAINGLGAAIQPDGKIVAVGSVRSGSNYDFAMVRYNPNGSLDTSLDGDGRVTTAFSNFHDEAYSVVIQNDGKILLGGFASNNTNSDFALARYNSDGSPDNSFDTDGRVLTPVGSGNDRGFSVAVLPDGKILLGGDSFNGSTTDFAVVRYTSAGAVDTTFGNGGSTKANFGGGEVWATSLAVQQNGKILLAGRAMGQSNKDFAVARFLPEGGLDTSFNQTGKVTTDFGGTDDVAISVKIQPDGKLLLAGAKTTLGKEPAGDFAVARYLGDPVIPADSTMFDFDGDGKTDLSIFRPSNGEWWIYKSSNGGNAAFRFGSQTDKLTPADYTGDGKTDVAVFRPSTGEWFVLRSEDESYYSFPFGTSGDIPAPGDFDGDSKADAVVFRPSSATWYIRQSLNGSVLTIPFGASGDVPVVADYDGDGYDDIAIYRPASGEWWIRRTSTAYTYALQFGTPTDKAAPADYTGDGKTDIAFFRPSTGFWFVLRSEDNSFFSFPFGASGDLPVPGDYDGDGKYDSAVFRPSNSTWFINKSTGGTLIQAFGVAGDAPVPNAFIP
jgi:uncharacterized delta-60 repeat protein